MIKKFQRANTTAIRVCCKSFHPKLQVGGWAASKQSLLAPPHLSLSKATLVSLRSPIFLFAPLHSEARGKLGEQERGVGVARGAAGSNCSLLFVKHSTVNEPPCLALQKPFVIFCVKKKAFNNLTSRVPLQRPLNWCPYLFIIYVIFWWTITILGTVLYLGSFRSSTRSFVLLPIWCLTGSAS